MGHHPHGFVTHTANQVLPQWVRRPKGSFWLVSNRGSTGGFQTSSVCTAVPLWSIVLAVWFEQGCWWGLVKVRVNSELQRTEAHPLSAQFGCQQQQIPWGVWKKSMDGGTASASRFRTRRLNIKPADAADPLGRPDLLLLEVGLKPGLGVLLQNTFKVQTLKTPKIMLKKCWV